MTPQGTSKRERLLIRPLIRLLIRPLTRLLLAVGLLVAACPVAANTLLLDGRSSVKLWPAVTVLSDPDGAFSAADLAHSPAGFARPTGTPDNLGRRDEVVWLRAPFRVTATNERHYLLAIDYPALNAIDLHILSDGRVISTQRMGNQLPRHERALATRLHAAYLPTEPGDYELLMRIDTLSSLVLPMSFQVENHLLQSESRLHLTHGIYLGLALCMLLYSLAHWASLRDQVFLDYALMLAGITIFFLAYFGIGTLYLWPGSPRTSLLAAPVGIMLAIGAGTRFVRASLELAAFSGMIDRSLQLFGLLAALGMAGTLLGVIEYGLAQTLVTVLSIVVTLTVLPVAAIKSLKGDRDAAYVLLGWGFYTLGAVSMAGILRGRVEPTFWVQNLYPLYIVVEMAAWMVVLSRRIRSIRSHAEHATLESDTLRAMAQTDALTGLPNRRGLDERLTAALSNTAPGHLCAVYLLDLDGFKAVNDQFGHDVGDALLVEVGRRLHDRLSIEDVVARLGGDEFVVLADGLPDEEVASSIGRRMLAAFAEPIEVAGQRCDVGLTIGYAIAPADGNTTAGLLKRADIAMYSGKREGRGCIKRGARPELRLAG